MPYRRFCKTATLAIVQASRFASLQCSEAELDVIIRPNHYENQTDQSRASAFDYDYGVE
jgi:hypothetical protein